MDMPTRLRISLVIPAYNEESYLADCLRSALAQTVPFHEIIVVDNNSSDETLKIAARFPGVRVFSEDRQGVVHARNRGFDAATGDIIARIDADTRLPTNWSSQVENTFQNTSIGAITGKVAYYDIAFAAALSRSDALLRHTVAYLLGPNMALQGANMALRQAVWQKVRGSVCSKSGLHEDFDLAIHTVERGYNVEYEPNLHAAVAFRQAASSWRSFASYYLHCPKTYLDHGIKRGYWLLPVALGMIAAYPLLHVLSMQRTPLVRKSTLRVNPATFVD